MAQNCDNAGLSSATVDYSNDAASHNEVGSSNIEFADAPSSQASMIVIPPEMMSKFVDAYENQTAFVLEPAALAMAVVGNNPLQGASGSQVGIPSVLMDMSTDTEIGSTLRLTDIPLDNPSLELDNDISVEDLSRLVTEVESVDVGPDDFIGENAEVTDQNCALYSDGKLHANAVGSSIHQFIDHTDLSSSVFDKISSERVSSDCSDLNPTVVLPMRHPAAEVEVKQLSDGSLVRVTRTSLLTKPTEPSFSLEMPLAIVSNMEDSDNYVVVNVTDDGREPASSLTGQDEDSAMEIDGEVRLMSTSQGSGEFKNSYSCPQCGLMSPTPNLHHQHILSHCDDKPFKCTLAGCTWSFASQWRLNRHLKSHGAFGKPFTCSVDGCGRKFTNRSNLKTHLKVFHDESNHKVFCNVEGCGMSFKFVKQLVHHVEQDHPTSEKLQCTVPDCTATFVLSSQLEKHLQSHSNRQSWICEQCGKDLRWQSRYKEHMDYHNNVRGYKCEFEDCGMSFTTNSRLRRHEKTHTDYRPYQCNYEGCVKSFYRKEHLKAHVDADHKRLKPFACPIENCQSKFSSKCGMMAHVKKHYTQGAKSLRNCPLPACTKQCPSKASFYQHIHHHLSQADIEGFIEIVENLNLLSPEKIAMMNEAVSAPGVAGHPASVLEALLSTLQRFDVGNPFVFVQDAAYTAAKEVVVTAATHTEPPEKYLVDPDDVRAWRAQMSSNEPVAGTSKSDSDLPRLSTDALYADVEMGAARTDYIVNQLLSEHARLRLTMVRQGASLEGVLSLQDIVKLRAVPHVDDEDSDSDEYFIDSIRGFNPSDMLKSPTSMALKDPETGATYVQTQLLQDDPPGSLS